MNSKKKSSSKNFYIVISNKLEKKEKYTEKSELIKNDLKEKYFKIKEGLSRTGNQVLEINKKEEIIELFDILLNNKILNKKGDIN